MTQTPFQSEETPSSHQIPDLSRHKVTQISGTKLARERKKTVELMATLPKGITIGEWHDDRPKPFFVRYGRPRKAESFSSEQDRNDKALKLMDAREANGTSILNYDAAEWREFLEWKANHQRKVPMTSKAVEDYLKLRLDEDLKEGSDTHSHMVLHLGRFTESFSSRRLDHIKTQEIRDWLTSLKNPKDGKPMSKATLRHHRKDVNGLFRRAVMEEWVNKNPCEAVIPPKLDEEETIPLKPREVFDLLKTNLKERVVFKMALEIFGGLRASSTARLRKEHLKFQARGIAMPGVLHKSQKRKFRQGHPPVLWEWLNKAPEETWTISTRNYDQLKMLAFKLAHVKNPGNVLRHTFASYHLAMFKDMGKTGYLMQHRNRATTEGYEGIAEESDAALVFAMTPSAVAATWEEFLSKQPPTQHERQTKPSPGAD